ncbi:MAG: hypothetical protein JNK20_06530 [Flavipsychrobacter sp.]|nr:hypothetical protein [Flavipsychrobacter sp.]
MIKPLLYGLLVLLLGIAIVGHYLYQKEPARAEGQDAAFRLTAAELLEAFQQNEAAANDNYLGKWLEIRGVINLLNPEEGMVYLGEPAAAISVSCLLDSVLKSSPALLKVGDTVSIKGFCSGYLMDVQLTRAQVLP